MALLKGSILDERFELQSLLGSGGFGSVYLAQQPALNRTVAIKVLGDIDPESWKRFQREAKVLTMLQHQNIVQCYAFGIWKETPYIAMEYLQGMTLQQKLSTALPVADAIAVIREVCSAISYAHAHGIVHRDLKPGNIFLLDCSIDQAMVPLVKVIDFGLAKLLPSAGLESQKLTEAGSALGSASYMSPEQCTAGEVDQRSDIYALGCILYHCLTGSAPFTGENHAILMYQHVHQSMPELPADIPNQLRRNLQAIIENATMKSPDDRYKSADAMIADLDACAADSVANVAAHHASQPGDTHQTAARPKPKTFPWTTACLATAALAMVSSLWLQIGFQHHKSAPAMETSSDTSCPSPEIEHLCDTAVRLFNLNKKTEALVRLESTMKQPHTQTDQTELQLAYANCHSRIIDRITFLESKLKSSNDPNHRIRVYLALAAAIKSSAKHSTQSNSAAYAYHIRIRNALNKAWTISPTAHWSKIARLQLVRLCLEQDSFSLVYGGQIPGGTMPLCLVAYQEKQRLALLSDFDSFPESDARYDKTMIEVYSDRATCAADHGDIQLAEVEAGKLLILLNKHPWCADSTDTREICRMLAEKLKMKGSTKLVEALETISATTNTPAPPALPALNHILTFTQPALNDESAAEWLNCVLSLARRTNLGKKQEEVAQLALSRADINDYPSELRNASQLLLQAYYLQGKDKWAESAQAAERLAMLTEFYNLNADGLLIASHQYLQAAGLYRGCRNSLSAERAEHRASDTYRRWHVKPISTDIEKKQCGWWLFQLIIRMSWRQTDENLLSSLDDLQKLCQSTTVPLLPPVVTNLSEFPKLATGLSNRSVPELPEKLLKCCLIETNKLTKKNSAAVDVAKWRRACAEIKLVIDAHKSTNKDFRKTK